MIVIEVQERRRVGKGECSSRVGSGVTVCLVIGRLLPAALGSLR